MGRSPMIYLDYNRFNGDGFSISSGDGDHRGTQLPSTNTDPTICLPFSAIKCSRNDAQVARQSGFVVTSSLVESLHQSSQHVTGHESAVLSGGLRTAAHAAEKPTHCALCHNEVCPTTDHIYWFCSHFQHLRQWPRPINDMIDMIARVGWNTNGMQYPIVQQMHVSDRR